MEMESSFNDICCPIDTEWKFMKADLMELKENGYLTGKYFYAYNIPGIQYAITIFPYGGDRGLTEICFHICGLKERKIYAEYTISIESANYSEKLNNVFVDDTLFGTLICKAVDFFDTKSKYFVHDEITIQVKGTLEVKRSSVSEICCPIDTEWKFKKSDLMELKENGYLTGKYFYAYNIPGLHYAIVIFPKDKKEGCLSKTGIHLFVNGSEERKIDADYTLSVESANYAHTFAVVSDEHCAHGSICCQTAEFFDSKSKYFVHGEITIKVNGTLKIKRPSVSIISIPISLQWKVKEADLIEAINEGGNGIRLHSEDVNIASFSDIKYKLSLRPNKINEENVSKAYLYLNVDNENEEKIQAVFDFSIVSANYNYGTEYDCLEFDKIKVHVCSTEDLFDPSEGYFVDGNLTIKFNGILMVEKTKYFTLNCKKSVMKKNDKDFEIVVGQKKIQVHKKVLSDVSPVFAGMLESGKKEIIIIHGFEFKVVDISIKLCYGKSVLLKYSLETLLSLYKFGHEYRIPIVLDLIEEYLIKYISPSNVVYLIKFSATDSFNINKLYQKCIEFFIKCSKDSTPVYAAESLGEKFLASMVLNTFAFKC